MAMPAGRKPDPGEEKVLWRHDIRKGVFRRRTVGTLAVTSRRIIGIDAQIPLQELDDVLVRNRRETATHSGTSRREIYGKWDNVAAQIASISLTNAQAGDFGVGTRIEVWGFD